jgi:NAD(P)-dependent dehydrogenase (short-subunit alcohol dehydrogenase family)
MAGKKVALVTGGNKGIGFEVARQLGAKGFQIVLTARNPGAGETAVGRLPADALFVPMDVSDDGSIAAAARMLGERTGALDVLVNNAGVYPDEGVDILTVPRDRLVQTFQTNTFGALRVIQEFLPMLRNAGGARVINLSSGYGQLDGLAAGVPSYCLSKLTLNGITIMLHQALQDTGISVNSMCPGWVRTDMGGANASRSVEEGADTAVWLAAEAPASLSGKFFRDRREISW